MSRLAAEMMAGDLELMEHLKKFEESNVERFKPYL